MLVLPSPWTAFVLVLCACLLNPTSACDSFSVANGNARCDDYNCLVECNLGFVASGNVSLDCQDPALKDKAKCVRTMAFVVGGSSVDSLLSSVELLSSNSSLSSRPMPDFAYAVESPVALWVTGKIVVCGGFHDDVFEDRCWQFVPCSDSWAELEEMLETRFRAVGVADHRGWPVVMGGLSDTDTPTTSSEMWNVTDHSVFWQRGPDMQTAKTAHCAVTKENGRVVTLTGGDLSPYTTEEVNLETGEHTAADSLLSKRSEHACGMYQSSFGPAPMVAGGNGDFVVYALDTVETFNPLIGRWEEDAPLPEARLGAAIVTLDDKPTIIGGRGRNDVFAHAQAYDRSTKTWWEFPTALANGRAFAGVVAVPVDLFDRCSAY